MKLERRRTPRVDGKFFQVGGERFYLKGITYGPFAPDSEGNLYKTKESVDNDFLKIKEAGFNTVRIYVLPPVWLLDLAEKHDLKVMLGFSWEQYLSFLDYKDLGKYIKKKIKEDLKPYIDHESLLCVCIGNEIPASVVRWLGPSRVENFLRELYQIVKSLNPLCLVTYSNYPSTEYLKLNFLDFICFNVYLEDHQKFSNYLSQHPATKYHS